MLTRTTKSQTQEIRVLLDRLKKFEQIPQTPYNRSILEIGISTIRERLRDLSRFRPFDRPSNS
ncbi:MAG: hypothetical protein L0216_04880 [Planctomycetales bacterium]|nr:hypothetical protein [Planctomycetales bacterium]